MSTPVPPPFGDVTARLNRLRTYAWGYFAFHEEQRMKTFHFYLLLVGAIIAALITLRAKTGGAAPITEALLCFLVSFVSIVFYLLDCRNCELVQNGENALRHLDELEGHERVEGQPHVLELIARDDHHTSRKPGMPSREAHYSYTGVLKVLFLCFGTAGAIAGIFRLVSLSSC